MKYILDTNVFIDLKDTDRHYKNFIFTDISLYEMLKHKTIKEKEVRYNTIINFISKTRMNISSTNNRFLKTLGLEYNKVSKRIDDLCLCIYKDMMKNYISLITALTEIIYLKINNIRVEGDYFVTEQNVFKENVSIFLNAISRATIKFEEKFLHGFCKTTLKSKENISTSKLEIALINIIREHFDKRVIQGASNLNKIDNCNFNDLVKNNNLTFANLK